MKVVAVEHAFTGATTPYTAYDSNKTTLGKWIVQNAGSTPATQWAGPADVAVARGTDTHLGRNFITPYILKVSNTLDWIFMLDDTSGNKYIALYEFDRSTFKFTVKGSITFAAPGTGYSLSVSRHLYSTGTVGVSGTAVTGSNTGWKTARYASGARIGFGSTNWESITQWYEISAITNDTSITLTSSAGTITSGTPFVIDELRMAVSGSNGLATGSGLYVVKGISVDTFSTGSTPTTISIATTTDNVRAYYWLSDAATTTMLAGIGVAQEAPISDTEHYVYFINRNANTQLQIFKFNIRAALSDLSAGKSTIALVAKTGVSAVGQGTFTAYAQSRIFTMQHGPSANVPAIYVASASRIYCIPLNRIYDTNTAFIGESFMEIPTGSAGTMFATGIYSVDYWPEADVLVIGPASAGRGYITKWHSNGDPLDNWFITPLPQVDRYYQWDESVPIPNSYATNVITWTSEGVLYYIRNSAGAHYAIPMVHWDYAGTANTRLITPAFSVTKVNRYLNLFVNNMLMAGSDSLGQGLDPFRAYARADGIEDDSGEWVLLDDTGDLSFFNPDHSNAEVASKIQFMFEFNTPSWTLPARIHSILFTYEMFSTDSHFVPSLMHCNRSEKQFVWRFAEAFGMSVPALRAILIDDNSNEILVDDDTDSPAGTFEKSVNGGRTWTAWNNTDRTNDVTLVRFTPVTLPANRRVCMVLTLK